MKISVNRKEFLDSIIYLTNNTSKSSLVLALQNIHMKVGDQITLRKTDLEIDLSCTIPFGTKEGVDEEILINPTDIIPLLKAITVDIIDIETEYNTITIREVFNEYKIPYFDSTDYIVPKSFDTTESVNIVKEDLVTILDDATSYTAGKNDLRESLKTINMKFNNDTITVIASDAQKLYKRSMMISMDSDVLPMVDICIPLFSVKSIVNLMKEKDDKMVRFTFCYSTEGVKKKLTNISVSCGNKISNVLLADTKFPDVDKLITKNQPVIVKINREEVLSVIKKLQSVSNESLKDVVIFLNEDHVIFNSLDVDRGKEGNVKIEASVTGKLKPITNSYKKEGKIITEINERQALSFNLNYLNLIFNTLQSKDVYIRAVQQSSLSLFFPTEEENNSYTILLAPIIVDRASSPTSVTEEDDPDFVKEPTTALPDDL